MPPLDARPTPYDILFLAFGVPVRIHPLFWVVLLVLGVMGIAPEPAAALVWVATAAVAVLVHELGHAFAARRFGGDPRIQLYAFGGLTRTDGMLDTPGRQLGTTIAGPAAGLVLAALLYVALAVGGQAPDFVVGLLPVITFERFEAPLLNVLIYSLWIATVWWSLFNLLPIYPLDGGRIARELGVVIMKPATGIVVSLALSIACAACVAALCLVGGSWLLAAFMIALGYNNYVSLENYRRSYGR